MNNENKIIDVIILFNELDLLEFRLNYLNDLVDYFIIVEANKTFQLNDKPFYFAENKVRYSNFLHKICNYQIKEEYNQVDKNPIKVDIWQKEHMTDAIIDFISSNQDYDSNYTIMISDADEIPKKERILDFIKTWDGSPHTCEQIVSYYYMNCRCENMPWFGTCIFDFMHMTSVMDIRLKKEKYLPTINNCGWHFSFLGGLEMIKSKLKAYGHDEYNSDYWLDDKKLIEHIKNGEDILERHYKYKYLELDNTFPDELLNNQEKYKGFIL